MVSLGAPQDRFPNRRGAACRRALGLLLSQDPLAFSHLFSAAMHVSGTGEGEEGEEGGEVGR